MKLGGQMDYHGSRAYAPDLPSVTAESWVKRLAGPFTAWAKHMLEMLLKPGARQVAETMWLVHGEERHFSVLGADHDRKRRRVAASSSRHLYLLSMSQTVFWTSRWTIVSSETPPCWDCDTPSTDVDVVPTSIFSSA